MLVIVTLVLSICVAVILVIVLTVIILRCRQLFHTGLSVSCYIHILVAHHCYVQVENSVGK